MGADRLVTPLWAVNSPLVRVVLAFIAARVIVLVAVAYDGLLFFSDVRHFYQLAALPGWPFFGYWVEYPPLFPFLSKLIYHLTAGSQPVYSYAFMALFTLAEVGCLILFSKIAARLHPRGSQRVRLIAYTILLLVLPYGLWYFDPLAVFLLLLGIWLLMQERDVWAALTLGLGFLTKLFPVLALVWVWRRYTWKRALRISLLTAVLPVAIYAILIAVSPRFTLASLGSQGAKGSWETVWALLDGNLNTGLFGPLWQRADPAYAWVSLYKPALIPAYLTLIAFAGLGLAGFLRSTRNQPLGLLGLVGLAWSLLMLWSRGWSVQWVLYILPLILLVLPFRPAILISLLLILDNILEYPIAVAKGQIPAFTLAILLRAGLFCLLAVLFYRQARAVQAAAEPARVDYEL